MFSSNPTCPVEQEIAAWIETRMRWLSKQFGRDKLRSIEVVLPTPEYFPDVYDASDETIRTLMDRVCGYMGVLPSRVQVSIYQDRPPVETDGLVRGTAGLYVEESGEFRIWIEEQNLNDPLALVATMAHELGHALLLGEGRITADDADHEPLTDLQTVFLGLGVIAANSVVRESTSRMGHYSWWGMSSQGYLTMQMYGYALAVFARERDEDRPAWARHLRPDVRKAFEQGQKFLRNGSSANVDDIQKSIANHSTKEQLEPAVVVVDKTLPDSVGTLLCDFCGAEFPSESEQAEAICFDCRLSVYENELAIQKGESNDVLGHRYLRRIWLALIIGILLCIAAIVVRRMIVGPP